MSKGDCSYNVLLLSYDCSPLKFNTFAHYILLHYLSQTSVPPVVVSLADNQEVIGNTSDAVILEFRIDAAAPLVALEDLTWYYSPTLVTTPQGEDITGLTNRTSQSMLAFSPFANNMMISLTVSNLVRDVAGEGETDEGRYFLVARNPAGISFDYIDLVIFGELCLTTLAAT